MMLETLLSFVYPSIITFQIRFGSACRMISAAQLRAARALLGLDQRQLAELAGLSAPTIQRMEASEGLIRGNVDSLMKLTAALDRAGVELIAEGAASRSDGRGVRLKAADAARALTAQTADEAERR